MPVMVAPTACWHHIVTSRQWRLALAQHLPGASANGRVPYGTFCNNSTGGTFVPPTLRSTGLGSKFSTYTKSWNKGCPLQEWVLQTESSWVWPAGLFQHSVGLGCNSETVFENLFANLFLHL